MSDTDHQTLHCYTDYGWLRGFNVVPSWGARIEQAWWDYDGARLRAEVAPAAAVHANCIRLWIEFTAWMADPRRVQADFMDAVEAIGDLGMTVMPCLFNRWHDTAYDYGGTYEENLRGDLRPMLGYVEAIVAPLIADDRILAWDLCNEPQAEHADQPVAILERAWLSAVAAAVRGAGARQPITIGVYRGLDVFAPLCDVLCCHPYGQTAGQQAELLVGWTAAQRRHGKPMLSNETVPGCLDDGRRADLARATIPLMEDSGFGWMGWGMREGSAVSTRRDRYDANGIDRQGFHAWFRADGSLRPGLEFLLQPPRRPAPWAATGLRSR